MKRFSSKAEYIDKIDTFVRYPLQKLSLADYMIPAAAGCPKGHLEYDLFAVVNHHTYAQSGGHYTAHVQIEEGKEAWVLCNDTILSSCTSAEAVNSEAYLLFYRRRVLASSNVINLTYQSFS